MRTQLLFLVVIVLSSTYTASSSDNETTTKTTNYNAITNSSELCDLLGSNTLPSSVVIITLSSPIYEFETKCEPLLPIEGTEVVIRCLPTVTLICLPHKPC
eukprot:PhF_6_TR33526/c0_g1_i1/m.48862